MNKIHKAGVQKISNLKSHYVSWLFVLPALCIYLVIVIFPTLQSIWLSFFEWNGVSIANWVGLENYVDFFQNPKALVAIKNTLLFIVFFAIFPLIIGLISASLVSKSKLFGVGAFRVIIFLPQVLTSVVIVVIWKSLFSVRGAVNNSLNILGIDANISWLGSFDYTVYVLGAAGTWATIGFCMLLFLSGIASIPEELYDACKVDGGGSIRSFFSITLPGVVPQIVVSLTITTISAIRVFDLVWLSTRGGPGYSTYTPSILLYTETFTKQNVGAGSAIGVILAITATIVTLLIIRINKLGS